jgi:hypothetical protein
VQLPSSVELQYISRNATKKIRFHSDNKRSSSIFSLSLPFNLTPTLARSFARLMLENLQAKTDTTATVETSSAFVYATPGSPFILDGESWYVRETVFDTAKIKMLLSLDSPATAVFEEDVFESIGAISNTEAASLRVLNVPVLEHTPTNLDVSAYLLGSMEGRIHYSLATNTPHRSSANGPTALPISGVLTTVPPNVISRSHLQADGSLEVTFPSAVDPVLFGAQSSRMLLVGAEWIKYDSVVFTSGDTVGTFHGLIRGIKNTDFFTDAHVVGETVYLYEPQKFIALVGPRGAENTPRQIMIQPPGTARVLTRSEVLKTNWLLPSRVFRRDDTEEIDTLYLAGVRRFWHAPFVNDELNDGNFVLSNPADPKTGLTLNVPSGVDSHSVYFCTLSAPFDAATFFASIENYPNSYILAVHSLGDTPNDIQGTELSTYAANRYWAVVPSRAIFERGFRLDGIIAYGELPAFGAFTTEIPTYAGTSLLGGTRTLRMEQFKELIPTGYFIPT